MTRAIVAACLLALPLGVAERAATSQGERQAPAADRGVLGVMRRDGLLIPFAAYKGSRWAAPWPATARNLPLPVNLSSIPPAWWGGSAPDSWRLHLAAGTARPLAVNAPRVYRTFCDTRLGLLTDYRSDEPVPMPPPAPYPKDGLATSPGLELLPIESVDRASPEAARLAGTLMPEFDKAEEKTVTLIRNMQGWTHPEKREARRARPVTIEAWYRAPLDEPGWTASYVEAVRSYPPGPKDEGCGLETIFTGWMLENAATPRRAHVQLTARVTYCDRRGATYVLPFGRFRVRDQLYWAYQLSGFEHEWYVVARVSPSRVALVVEAYGGGREACPVGPGP